MSCRSATRRPRGGGAGRALGEDRLPPRSYRSRERKARSVALPAVGTGPGGISSVISRRSWRRKRFACAGRLHERAERVTLLRAAAGVRAVCQDGVRVPAAFPGRAPLGAARDGGRAHRASAGVVLVTRSNPPLGCALPAGSSTTARLEAAVRREAARKRASSCWSSSSFTPTRTVP